MPRDGLTFGTIQYRDGWMCAVCCYPDFDKPEYQELWWPIERATAHDMEVLDLTGAKCELRPDGRVIYKLGKSPHALWSRDGQYLKDGSKTLPIHSVAIPIPCPKVRNGVKTRFFRGIWEKYLASKGWQPA